MPLSDCEITMHSSTHVTKNTKRKLQGSAHPDKLKAAKKWWHSLGAATRQHLKETGVNPKNDLELANTWLAHTGGV